MVKNVYKFEEGGVTSPILPCRGGVKDGPKSHEPLPTSPKGRRAWRSRMSEGGINLGDLGREEGAAAERCKMA